MALSDLNMYLAEGNVDMHTFFNFVENRVNETLTTFEQELTIEQIKILNELKASFAKLGLSPFNQEDIKKQEEEVKNEQAESEGRG